MVKSSTQILVENRSKPTDHWIYMRSIHYDLRLAKKHKLQNETNAHSGSKVCQIMPCSKLGTGNVQN